MPEEMDVRPGCKAEVQAGCAGVKTHIFPPGETDVEGQQQTATMVMCLWCVGNERRYPSMSCASAVTAEGTSGWMNRSCGTSSNIKVSWAFLGARLP